MRLPQPFQRLSVRFDADRMREEIEPHAALGLGRASE